MTDDSRLKPLGLGMSIVLFGIPAFSFYVITRILIPHFKVNWSIHPLLVWFIFGGFFLFIPLFVLSIVFFKRDEYDFNRITFFTRFRLTRLNKRDWFWAVLSLCAILVSMAVIMLLWRLLSSRYGITPLDTSTPFLQFTPLRGAEVLLLLVWVPFFFFNIVGEELMWRGYILPRQELAFGGYAWLINALLWTVFHLFFGLHLLILLLPSLFIIPYVVYKRQKTLIGIVIHALLNGPAFILVALGILK
jgi:membrane protease YdiL (CAAX protease family)